MCLQALEFFFHKMITYDLTEILTNIWVNVALIDKLSTNFIEPYLPAFIKMCHINHTSLLLHRSYRRII